MSNIFNPDSKFTHYANKFSDLITLNLWFAITSIPLLTIGASATAMHYVLLRIYRDELEYSVTKNYFQAFKQNFKQATTIWLIYLLLTAVLIADYYWVNVIAQVNTFFLKIVISIVALLLLFSLSWVFALQSRYANPVHATIRNAIIFCIMHPMDTVLMCAMLLLPILLLISKPSTIPIIIICGFSLSGIVRTMIYSKIFACSELSQN